MAVGSTNMQSIEDVLSIISGFNTAKDAFGRDSHSGNIGNTFPSIAGGGYVLYPSKRNTSAVEAVHAK